ncbi:hypothetical protein MTR_1g037510 [Medicago truncatula]|uniref:Cysteine-rich receptor-like protein kinase n=1 Tax=Medicago truncatula TaxID=3880 RepID=A0A072VGM6_MEDTR|nr:hypothetical protein MTR_1g037510 [Medicago truncatula]
MLGKKVAHLRGLSYLCLLPRKIESLKARLSILDCKGEDEVLSDANIKGMHGITSDILSLSRINTSICWQQSRMLWLKEGGANSKYFHLVLSSRRRGGGLIKPFSKEEVKSAVWDCDSFKILRPDGVNFGFIKKFWNDIKNDILRFISEFCRNDKLTKGSVISESQTMLVKDRQILDGILIAKEEVDEARYEVGSVNSTVIFHLQFVNDTLLLGVKSWANVRALWVVLVLFELISGLKVNFNKSTLVRVNIAATWLSEAVTILG